MTSTHRSRTGRAWLGVGLFYGLLLLISLGVRQRPAPAIPIDPLERQAQVNAVDRGRVTAARVTIAYQDFTPESGHEGETILLLHGSPGRKEDFSRLAPLLAHDARVIVPDLPGFGSSTSALPDYSFRAHALYMRQLMDVLHVEQAHVLGYSMGGGVALSLVDLAPGRLASLTMLSAIGVQEMELTGDYYVNHLVHGVQLAALWALREGTPHMGVFDGAVLGVPYARNFYDSDQRPLRGILQRVTAPTLIVHGTDDDLVPIEAAEEHHRLVPQSELVTLAGDHIMVFRKAADLGAIVSPFVRRVAQGGALTRAGADPERVRLAAVPLDPSRLPRVRGIAAAVLAAVLAATAAISGTVGGASAGSLLARGRVGFSLAMTGCVVGMSLGGVFRLFSSRLLGRTPKKTSLRLRLTAVGRTVLVAAAAVVVGDVAFRFSLLRTMSSYPGFAVTFAAVASAAKLGPAVATERGRRLLVSTWRRTTNWELWPPWVFYPPVLVYILFLMAKYRSATLFTAADPAILAGGFVGESKYDILQGLAGAGDTVARSCLIAADLSAPAKALAAKRFMADRDLTFPIVLKPNCGQRGSGVVIVRSGETLDECLRHSSVDTIVQEYVAGSEFGVFYYRYPSEPHGHIFSITEKKFPSVVGDGHRTLEALILQDERAVCAARLYLDRYRERLSSVPAGGETIALAELGTHCRGALFLDGDWVRTGALEERFDAIARGFDGFYFGRFDVRAQGGIDAFRAGHGFKIIELNGVTSEATHIYQPGTPLVAAYRVLMRQWRIAFEIGAANHRRGTPTTPVRTLVQLAREYSRTSRRHLREHA